MITVAIWLAWAAFFCLDLSTLPTKPGFSRVFSYSATILSWASATIATFAVNQ